MDFSERRPEEVISFFWRSVYLSPQKEQSTMIRTCLVNFNLVPCSGIKDKREPIWTDFPVIAHLFNTKGVTDCSKCTVPLYPFHKNIPQLSAFKNNADNSIKIAFTNSELSKIIRTLVTSGHQKHTLKRRMSMRGRGDLWPRLGNCPHYFGIAFTNPKSGPDVAIMRIVAASKKCGLLCSRSDFTTK